MGIDGKRPDWSDFRVAFKVRDIDRQFIGSAKSEKLVHVDWEWREGNRYHSYVSRYVQCGKTRRIFSYVIIRQQNSFVLFIIDNSVGGLF